MWNSIEEVSLCVYLTYQVTNFCDWSLVISPQWLKSSHFTAVTRLSYYCKKLSQVTCFARQMNTREKAFWAFFHLWLQLVASQCQLCALVYQIKGVMCSSPSSERDKLNFLSVFECWHWSIFFIGIRASFMWLESSLRVASFARSDSSHLPDRTRVESVTRVSTTQNSTEIGIE